MPSIDPEGPPLLTRTRQWTRPSPETHILFLILSSHLWQVSSAVSCHKMLELKFCTRYVSLCLLPPVSISVAASPRYHHSFCECNSLNNRCLLYEIYAYSFSQIIGRWKIVFCWPAQLWFEIAQLYKLGCIIQYYCPFRKFITYSAVLDWQELLWPSRRG